MRHVEIFTECTQLLHTQKNFERSLGQQAYMKSAMPFFGLPKPAVDDIMKTVLKKYPPTHANEYQKTIQYFFDHATHREQWYAGLTYALRFKKYQTPEAVPLYLSLIKKTQWWDIVDVIAPNLIGKILQNSDELETHCLGWITHDCMWVRRAALLVQLRYKEKTNTELQKKLILSVAHEKEFFIRKAIGWSLRELSKTNSTWVQQFLSTHNHQLSPLSVREARKYMYKKSCL